jgi:hypothetical protein
VAIVHQMYRDDGLSRDDVVALLKRFDNQVGGGRFCRVKVGGVATRCAWGRFRVW